MPLDDWSLTVGEIVAPFGLAGEVKVRLETDFPDRFARLPRVCLRWKDGSARLAEVEGARLHKTQVLLKLRGCDDANAAELLRNVLVQIQPKDAVKLPSGEYYIHDLIGCEAFTPAGESLGAIADVIRGGANDVWVLRGSARGEILLPAIKDVVKSVDVGSRKAVVDPTPGLLPGESDEVR